MPRTISHAGRSVVVVTMLAATVTAAAHPQRLDADELTVAQAEAALDRAVAFFRDSVATHGGYVWRYSADLQLREGEGQASPTTAWVQPPGSPTVGLALLNAYYLTGNKQLLEAARETAHSLVAGQLESGGWDYRIEYAPKDRQRYRYRVEPDRPQARNTTTLDDDTTQASLRFLMRTDQALEFQDTSVHDAARYALQRLLAAQYPNGAWPQRFDRPLHPDAHPVLQASYPDSWPREFPKSKYQSYYTFNDNSLADMIDTMLDAAAIYDQPQYRQAAKRAGDFILRAQMPEPQPAWAQQYDAEMHPAWARKFEPPAVTGGESQGVLRTLLMLYRETGDAKFLAPLPSALDYLRRSELPDGRLARFYELRTNRPLYFTRAYELTYQADDLPTHYGFIVGSSVDRIQAEYERLRERGPQRDAAESRRDWRPTTPRMTRSLANRARAVADQLDARGAWVERGDLRANGKSNVEIIDVRTFTRGLETLAEFIAAMRQDE